jgi:hypothetical protein
VTLEYKYQEGAMKQRSGVPNGKIVGCRNAVCVNMMKCSSTSGRVDFPISAVHTYANIQNNTPTSSILLKINTHARRVYSEHMVYREHDIPHI